jgi:glycosyltransferase involved in cell wall biosynthesis
MICHLAELPPPPPGKTGWPWTEPCGEYPPALPDGRSWPRLSIITPSFNQALYLEETIRSVLLQGYPDLEYMVVDGGSTDGSLEIIQRYAPWLAYWVSEKDNGQAEAINKGLQRSTGVIAGWINSDDIYFPNAWQELITHLAANPGCVLAYRDCTFIDQAGQTVGHWQTQPQSLADLLLGDDHIPQPTALMNAQVWRSAGGMDCRFHYILDFDLWVRLGLAGKMQYFPGSTAGFRLHSSSKTLSYQQKFIEEYFIWLTQSPYLAAVQTEAQRSEAEKRIHIRAALAYIFDGKADQAVEHFQAALQGGGWPYGGLDALAEHLFYAQSHNGLLHQQKQPYLTGLYQVLRRVKPHRLGRQLGRRTASLENILPLFSQQPLGPRQARQHYIRGIYYNPGWLRNRGVQMIGIELFLGRRFANWLRQRF